LVNPHAAASATFSSVSSVTVSGGDRWVPGWKKGVTAYQKPTSAVVRLLDGSKKSYTNPDAVEVTNGSMSSVVMGDMGSGGAPSVAPSISDFAAAVSQGAASAIPSDGRPAQGWSQSQPAKMGPAITPDSGGGFLASMRKEAWSGAPFSRGQAILGGIAGSAILGGIFLALRGKGRK
jgi:hypothetical protein